MTDITPPVNQAEQTTHNDCPFDLHTNGLLSHRKFVHRETDVEERIYDDPKHGCCQLVWCLNPFEMVVKNGVRNYLIHAKFDKREFGSYGEVSAREVVRRLFEKHHRMLAS